MEKTFIHDADRNVYNTVTIGKQTWTVENLRTTKYNDGTAIPLITDINISTPGYCWYDNDESTNNIIYGALYNWYAVDTKKLAPKGYHVPTNEDWDILQNYLIANGHNYDGTKTGNKIAKSMAAQTNWSKYSGTGTIGNDLSKNNKSGFSALPGGFCDMGNFCLIGSLGDWWSATESEHASSAYYSSLSSTAYDLYWGCQDKCCGLSVRLLEDN